MSHFWPQTVEGAELAASGGNGHVFHVHFSFSFFICCFQWQLPH
jgi:hypothetical protein